VGITMLAQLLLCFVQFVLTHTHIFKNYLRKITKNKTCSKVGFVFSIVTCVALFLLGVIYLGLVIGANATSGVVGVY
jgi:LytS/YehU family sensor histidine kinase